MLFLLNYPLIDIMNSTIHGFNNPRIENIARLQDAALSKLQVESRCKVALFKIFFEFCHNLSFVTI